MPHRFAAASVVASITVAAGALLAVLLPVPPDGVRILTLVWCFVPAVWGLWAMLAPQSWVPERLPLWGAILGVGGGAVAWLVVNVPARFGGPAGVGWLALLVGPVLYYVLWLLVRGVYHSLYLEDRPAPKAGARVTAA